MTWSSVCRNKVMIQNDQTQFLSTDGASDLHFTRPLVNVTKEAGDSIRLRCEAAGGARRIRWLKNEAPVVEERGRVAIRSYIPGADSKSGQDHGGGNKNPSQREEGKPHRDSINDLKGSESSANPTEAPPIGSRLRIAPLETHDMGFYTCVASDGKRHIGVPATIPDFAPAFPNFPALGGSYRKGV
ncbi:hypothetical protein J437_LFUL012921 [Ladona fulva]|uniref:Ig-like domain-containing protein n=1 Tax=Ladona fulva TaxID=123851 RepID=A0A8K0KE14_LADFU|nr:hypothetical protein J437_LFUL012921 [Ladona fulva]